MIQSFAKQPPGRAQIARKWSNRLVLAGHQCGGLSDAVINGQWTWNSATIAQSSQGPAWSFNGSSTYLSRADAALVGTSAGFSLMCVVTPRTLATDRRIFAFGSSSSNNPLISIKTNSATASTATFECRGDVGGSVVESNVASSFVAGLSTVVVGVMMPPNVMTCYTVNGSGTATFPGTATLNRTALGCLLRAAASSFAACDVSMWAAWNRPLSVHEVYELIGNPWQMFGTQSARFYDFPETAGGSAAPVFYHHRQSQGMAA